MRKTTPQTARERASALRRSAPLARKRRQTPTVITRTGKVVVPVRRMVGSPARRRYAISLAAPGTELRLPALPSVRWSWRLVSGLITALLVGVLYVLWTSPEFRVQSAQLAGLERMDARDVNLVLGLADTPVFLLEPESMRRNLLEAFPEFSEASVRIQWPNAVSVSVVERVPVLAWTVGGQTVWVDAQGMSFPVRGKDPAAAPVEVQAAGPPPSPPGAGELAAGESAWARPLMRADLVAAILVVRGLAPQGVPLLYDTEHGLGWRDPQGWQVYLGFEGAGMGQRLQIYQALVAALQARNIHPTLISVEYLHAPYYRID